jgi:hypothetical protein
MVGRLPLPLPPPRGRSRTVVYSDRLVLRAVVVMVVRYLTTVDGLLGVLAQPTAEMVQVRNDLRESGARADFEQRRRKFV